MKYKLFKDKMFTRVISMGCAAIMVLSAAGCSKTTKKDENDNAESITSTVDENELSIIETVNDQIDIKAEELNDLLKDKFYLNDDDLKSSVTILNIDYISRNAEYDENGRLNRTALELIYPNGLNVNKELNDFNTFLSKYREYTRKLNNTSDFFRISDLCLINTDQMILEEIENIIIDLIKAINLNNIESVKKIYNKLSKFYTEDETINVNGINYSKNSLSNGARKASEVYGNILSVISKDIIPEEQRTELDNNLRTVDSLYNIKTLFNVLGNSKQNIVNQLVNTDDDYVLDEFDYSVIDMFEDKYEEVKDYVLDKISVSDKEVEAIVILANLDYLASDNVSAGAMKTIITDDISDILSNAKSFIKTVSKYNNKHKKDLIIYDYMFVDDEENEINKTAIRGVMYAAIKLSGIKEDSTESEVYNNEFLQFIENYNLYSSDATITGNDGNKITKNDTGYGTRFITNVMSDYAVKKLPYNFEGILNLVNDDNDDLSVIPSIKALVDEKCSNVNIKVK